jgi:hypothetical protein
MKLGTQIFDMLKDQVGPIRDICLSDVEGLADHKPPIEGLLKLFEALRENTARDDLLRDLSLVLILSYESTSDLGEVHEPSQNYEHAYFYLVERGRIFSEAAEEYRKVISIIDERRVAIFRSYRDYISSQKRWEFGNSIYIFDQQQSKLNYTS